MARKQTNPKAVESMGSMGHPASETPEGNLKSRLALSQAIGGVRPSVEAVLPLQVASPSEWEALCAKAFNFDIPDNLPKAVLRLEQVVQTLSQTPKNAIFLFNESTGTYFCLNDEKYPIQRPRELAHISDRSLSAFLEAESVCYRHLFYQDELVGVVAVAEKDPQAGGLNDRDEWQLDMIAQYLATKVFAYQAKKQAIQLAKAQSAVLNVSGQLITAVDQETILNVMLQFFAREYGFSVCQYVAFQPETGEGEVLIECQEGVIASYTHAGLKSKRTVVKDLASLVSLFSSTVRKSPYLQISGRNLGDKPLEELFGIKKAKQTSLRGKTPLQATLIIPLRDASTGEVRGIFTLFHYKNRLLSEEMLEIVKEVTMLVPLALSRADVLEKALAMASSDELTGLTNRRGFYHRFEAEIERARRKPADICVAMIDVDFFKKLNDTYGHLNGDRVLGALAQTFLANFRKSDEICRFGGEEFAVLLPDISLSAAASLMERIRKKVEKLVITGVGGEKIRTSISIGLAQVLVSEKPTALSTPELISETLATADEQLYLAKTAGRNRICSDC